MIKKCVTDFPALVHCYRFLTSVIYALVEYYKIADSNMMITDEKEYVKKQIMSFPLF